MSLTRSQLACGRSPEENSSLSGIQDQCRASGLDVMGFACMSEYNVVANASQSVSADSSIGASNPLVLVLGNTKKLWPCFLKSLGDNLNAAGRENTLDRETHIRSVVGRNPLDRFLEKAVEAACSGIPKLGEKNVVDHILFSHTTTPGHMFSAQAAAAVAGLGSFNPELGLIVHEEYGPWISIRALIVTMLEGQPSPNTLSPQSWSLKKSRFVTHIGFDWRAHMKARLELCPDPSVRAWEFCAEQLEYHYTGSVAILVRLLLETTCQAPKVAVG